MRFLNEMEGLVSSQLKVIKTGLSMTRLEAKLAMLTVYPLIINMIMLFVIFIGTWLTLMGVMCYGLMQIVDSVILALSGVLILNVLILGVLLKYLLFNLKNMSFQKTRAYLSRGKDDELEKTGENGNREAEQEIMQPTESA